MYNIDICCRETWSHILAISLNQPVSHCESGRKVWPVGEWAGVWGAGVEGGVGIAGRAHVIHVGGAHRESKLSTFRSAKTHLALIFKLQMNL